MSRLNLLLFGTLYAVSAVSQEYITEFGADVVARADLIARGMCRGKVYLRAGQLISARVEAVYHGRMEAGKEIFLCYLAEVEIATDERVWFLQALGSPLAYRVIGEFSLREKEGEAKLQALEKVLQLETIPDPDIKAGAYVDYCIEGLGSVDSWTRVHASREWEHLLATQSKRLNAEAVAKLEGLYPKILDPDLRRRIQRDILAIERHSSAVGKGGLPADDWDYEVKQARQKLLSSAPTEEKIEALQLLSLFPSLESQDAFIAALCDSSVHVRANAVFYMGFHRYRAAIPHLLRTLHEDPSLRVRKNAILALAELQAVEAITEIRRYLKLPYTERAAQKALQRLSPSPELIPEKTR